MNVKLENLLKDVKTLEDEKSLLETKIKEQRGQIIEVLEKETDGGYKCEIATVSKVTRQTIKYQDKEATLQKLEELGLPKYFDIIPEEIIPEHKEINKTFEKDVKDNAFSLKDLDGVDVDFKETVQIRFNN